MKYAYIGTYQTDLFPHKNFILLPGGSNLFGKYNLTIWSLSLSKDYVWLNTLSKLHRLVDFWRQVFCCHQIFPSCCTCTILARGNIGQPTCLFSLQTGPEYPELFWMNALLNIMWRICVGAMHITIMTRFHWKDPEYFNHRFVVRGRT